MKCLTRLNLGIPKIFRSEYLTLRLAMVNYSSVSLKYLPTKKITEIEVCGFETNVDALEFARNRLQQQFPKAKVNFQLGIFFNYILERHNGTKQDFLFESTEPDSYDFIIANPPYVRTPVIGAEQAQQFSKQFNLSGRVDLYYFFILGISKILKPQGTAGIIVSNRFMTTKSEASIRKTIIDSFNICHAWDLGDTKLFKAAVLPAVLLVHGKERYKSIAPPFSSIYETILPANISADDPINALKHDGIVKIKDGRNFHVQHGVLSINNNHDQVWRIATKSNDEWSKTVHLHRWGNFQNIGKIRVDVKTCADKVFIRNDWRDLTECEAPELIKLAATHRIAHRFKPLAVDHPSYILYPHEVYKGNRRAIDITRFPHSNAYLNAHRSVLENRKYVIEGGRNWYEIWVPQDPEAWDQPKLVFRDIAEKPTFWIDLDFSVVNGDCYWLAAEKSSDQDLLWLAAAVANSTFIESYYDICFHNKLYAGRRRFMTQYVEKFPLPDPQRSLSKSIVAKAKLIYKHTSSIATKKLQKELDAIVWKAFTC